MSDQQALQDREKQIAILRELRKRRHEERAERPPRLLRGLDAPAVISKEEIKGLLKAEYQNLVVSLYLRLGPDKVAPTLKGLAGSSPLCPRIAWTIRFLVARTSLSFP